MMSNLRTLGSIVVLPFEYFYDFLRAFRWSKASPFAPKDKEVYYDAILLAHTIEKGLSQPSPRPGFGKAKIGTLLDLCDRYDSSWDQFPVEKAFGALVAYIEWHESRDIAIGPLEGRIRAFISDCESIGRVQRGGTKTLGQDMLDNSISGSGRELLLSRFSCRRFADQVVPRREVEQVIKIAQRAPSQCNRQSTRIHCYQNREDIARLLGLQRGAVGFSEGVRNLFVVTSEMTAWSGCNARNQSFVDGSLFAMQLSLACSSVGLGTCSLNLAVGNIRERKIRIAGRISHGERLILMLAFGYPERVEESLVVAKSERIPFESVVKFY